MDANAIVSVTDALANDDFVEQLWLKRNPLRSAGSIPLAKMLCNNNYLKVLDLTNTGLLDDGVKVICESVANNKKSAMNVLYLNANGITIECVPDICNMLMHSNLKDLGLGL